MDYGSGQPPRQSIWPTCCVASLLLILILGFLAWKTIGPALRVGLAMAEVIKEVGGTDLQTILASAQPVAAAELAANPEPYRGKWLAVSAVLETHLADGDDGKTTGYQTIEGILISDLSQAPSVGGKGDKVIAYGKVTLADLSSWNKRKQPSQVNAKDQMVVLVAKQVILEKGSR